MQRGFSCSGAELSKNFGQLQATAAGVDYSTGDWVVVMDCDLQDRPEEIPRMQRPRKATTLFLPGEKSGETLSSKYLCRTAFTKSTPLPRNSRMTEVFAISASATEMSLTTIAKCGSGTVALSCTFSGWGSVKRY
ncbi:MAG: glycosyltransferase [Lawsonibacter sp.]